MLRVRRPTRERVGSPLQVTELWREIGGVRDELQLLLHDLRFFQRVGRLQRNAEAQTQTMIFEVMDLAASNLQRPLECT